MTNKRRYRRLRRNRELKSIWDVWIFPRLALLIKVCPSCIEFFKEKPLSSIVMSCYVSRVLKYKVCSSDIFVLVCVRKLPEKVCPFIWENSLSGNFLWNVLGRDRWDLTSTWGSRWTPPEVSLSWRPGNWRHGMRPRRGLRSASWLLQARHQVRKEFDINLSKEHVMQIVICFSSWGQIEDVCRASRQDPVRAWPWQRPTGHHHCPGACGRHRSCFSKLQPLAHQGFLVVAAGLKTQGEN